LLIRLLSRYRELAADRSGALLTQNPSALINALYKVSDGYEPDTNGGPPGRGAAQRLLLRPAMKLTGGKSLSKIFSTHPSLEKRVEQLSKIQR